MICSLPPEILDIVIDDLHDQPTTLGACCLVSKSLVPRSRTHIFARVEFNEPGPSIRRWIAAFPDPLNSPAHYTRTLTVIGLRLVTGTGEDVTPWIRAFHNVVHLHVETKCWSGPDLASHVPFHGLSPAIRSLRLESPDTQPSIIFKLICSFPLLEDLTLLTLISAPAPDEWTTPSTSPTLTGSLLLSGGISPTITRRLLDLPNGLHFTKITLEPLHGSDPDLTADLVSRCSDTLEYLDITKGTLGVFPHSLCLTKTLPPPLDPATTLIDLSRATKLKHLVFRCDRPSVQWITMTLQTVGSKGLRQITLWVDGRIFIPINLETVYREWLDLDQLLVQFWTSDSIRPTVTYVKRPIGKDIGYYAPCLLPELTGRGLVDLVRYKR